MLSRATVAAADVSRCFIFLLLIKKKTLFEILENGKCLFFLEVDELSKLLLIFKIKLSKSNHKHCENITYVHKMNKKSSIALNYSIFFNQHMQI